MKKHFSFIYRILLIVLVTLLVIPAFSAFISTLLIQDENTNPFTLFDDEWDIAVRESSSAHKTEKINASSSFLSIYGSKDNEKEKSELDSYIVKFNESIGLSHIYSIIYKYEFELLAKSEERIFLLYLEDSQSFYEKNKEYVAYIEKNSVKQAQATANDPLLNQIWGYEAMNIYSAWDLTMGTSSVTVAVLDTGIDRAHEDLQSANILYGYNAYTNTNGVHEDYGDHGTKVAGIIAATANNGKGLAGVAPNVSIMPIIVGYKDSIATSDVIKAIRIAADSEADVINMSFGNTTYSRAEQDAIVAAVNKGCILVSAAGNTGTSEKFYPASYQGVISVASIGTRGIISSTSNHNDMVDVAAPGESIPLLSIDGGYETGLSSGSGTSFSCAYVSGIAALACTLISGNALLSSNEFQALIELSSPTGRTDSYGFGIIDAFAVLNRVNQPLVSGIRNGETYSEPIKITFNRGKATLDGYTFNSGDYVYENGSHTFVITDGVNTRTLNFTKQSGALTYELDINKKENYATVSFASGLATLNGVPYYSGERISVSGDYSFVLTQSNNIITESFSLSFDLPTVLGITENAVYTQGVHIRLIGKGNATLDGVPFSDDIVVTKNGTHSLILKSLDGSKTKTYYFTVNNQYSNNFNTTTAYSNIIPDPDNSYYLLYTSTMNGVNVFDKNYLFTSFLAVGNVIGYDFYGNSLLLYHENSITVLDREKIADRTGSVKKVHQLSTTASGFVLSGNNVLYTSANSLYSIDISSLNTSISLLASDLYTRPNKAFLSNGSYYFYNSLSSEGLIGAYNLTTKAVSYIENDNLLVGTSAFASESFIAAGVMVIDPASFSVEARFARVDSGIVSLAVIGSSVITNKGIYSITAKAFTHLFTSEVLSVSFSPNGKNAYIIYKNIPNVEVISSSDKSSVQLIALGAAVINNTVVDGVSTINEYSSYAPLYNTRHLSDIAVRDENVFIADGDTPLLYVADSKTFTQKNAIPLKYVPKQIRLSGNSIYVSFFQTTFIYSASLSSPSAGTYTDIGIVPDQFEISGDKLVVRRTPYFYVIDLDTLSSVRYAASSSAFTVSDGRIYSVSGKNLTVYDIALAQVLSFNTQAALSSVHVANGYIFTGGKIYNASTGSVVAGDFDSKVLVSKGNSVITSDGLYDMNTKEYISHVSNVYTHHFIDSSFNYYGAAAGSITIVHGYGRDFTDINYLSGITDKSQYTQGVSALFTTGICFLDGKKYTSNTVISKGGEHTLFHVFPYGVIQKYEFTIISKPETISFLRKERKISVGETIKLNYRFDPSGTTDAVTFSSSSNLINLNNDGVLTSLASGTATVKITSAGGLSDECIINISDELISFDSTVNFSINREGASDYLLGVLPGTPVSHLLSFVTSAGTKEVIASDGSIAFSDRIVGTGMSLRLYASNGDILDELKIVIKGDMDSDGYISANDIYHIGMITSSPSSYDEAYILAADIDGDGFVRYNDSDLLKLHLYGQDTISDSFTQPSNNTESKISALVKSIVFAGDTLTVALELSTSWNAYGVSGNLLYDSTCLTFKSVTANNWTTYTRDFGGNIGFAAYNGLEKGDGRSNRTLVSFEFFVSENADGKQIAFIVENCVLIGTTGCYKLENGITQRTVSVSDSDELIIYMENIENFVFDPSTLRYQLCVPYNISSLIISYSCPKGAKVTIGDTVIPESGILEMNVLYTYEGMTTTYIFIVERDKELSRDTNSQLRSLVAEGFSLNPSFHSEIFSYVLEVPYETTQLLLSCVPTSDKAKVEVTNPKLEVGENTITIVCYAEDLSSSTYRLVVTRKDRNAEIVSEESSDPPDKKAQKTSNYLIIIISCVSFAALIAIIILITCRRRNKFENKFPKQE